MAANPDLERFRHAQARDYATALAEIRSGRKRSHWMWYIFPQIAGLGWTEASRYYAIKDLEEARAFLLDKELGSRISTISGELLKLESNNATSIFGMPDDLKLHSSMTLFDAVPATFPVFSQVLDKFFDGKRDQRTLELLALSPQ